MGNPDRAGNPAETLRSMAIVAAIAVFFCCWGLMIFFTVGEKGPPSWDFGAMPDIPGQSLYSTHPIKEVADLTPLQVESGVAVEPQHVDGPPSKAGVMEEQRP